MIRLVILLLGLTTSSGLAQNDDNKELRSAIFQLLPLTPIKEVSLPDSIQVYFQYPGHDDNFEEIIVDGINNARLEVLFNQRVITSERVANALVAAKQRGVVIAGILEEDPTNVRNYNAPNFFIQNNIAIFFDTSHPGENKNHYSIIDRKVVYTGTLDWTGLAQTDSGNLLVISDPGIVVSFYNAWVTQLGSTKIPEKTEQLIRTLMTPSK